MAIPAKSSGLIELKEPAYLPIGVRKASITKTSFMLLFITCNDTDCLAKKEFRF
jgi:hypothetical protein